MTMQDSRVITYGVIGCGMMGQEHLRNIALLPGTAIGAIFEPDAAMRARAAALAPGEPVDGTRVAHALIAAAVTVVVHLLAGRRTLVSIASGTLAYVLLVNLA